MSDRGAASVGLCLARLRELDIRGVGMTEVGVASLRRLGPSLDSLNLGFCDKGVTNAALAALFSPSSSTTTTATFLALSAGGAVVPPCGAGSDTKGGSASSVLPPPALTSLDLWWCSQVTDAGIASVAQGSTSLRHLNIGGCRRITDAAMCHIGGGLRQLQSLNAWGCDLINPAGLLPIARHLPHLRSLSLPAIECFSLVVTNRLPEPLRAELAVLLSCARSGGNSLLAPESASQGGALFGAVS